MKTSVLKIRGTLRQIVLVSVLVLLLVLTSLAVFARSTSGGPARTGGTFPGAPLPPGSVRSRDATRLRHHIPTGAVCEPADDEAARALARMGIYVICTR